MTDRLQALLDLASRREGVRATEWTEDPAWAGRRLDKWHKDGKVFKLTLSFRNVRFFRDKSAADNYMAGDAGVVIKHKPSQAWWPKDAEPYYPPDVKITQCPSPKLCTTRNGWGSVDFVGKL